MGKMYYAVKDTDGSEKVFTNWPECNDYVKGKSNILYKGFNHHHEMTEWFKKQKINHSLILDPSYFHIYVDGSYNPKTGKAGWAWVCVKNNLVVEFEYGEVTGGNKSRQIDGELRAAAYAMLKYNGKKINIIHDYAGVAHFALGNWTPSTEVSFEYVKFLERAVDLKDVIFTKIKGHSGDEFNDMADHMAKKGCGIGVDK